MYRAWVEEILGLKVRGETLRLGPVIPDWWDSFQMNYRLGEAIYEFQFENPEHREQSDHPQVGLRRDRGPVQPAMIPLLKGLEKPLVTQPGIEFGQRIRQIHDHQGDQLIEHAYLNGRYLTEAQHHASPPQEFGACDRIVIIKIPSRWLSGFGAQP